MSEQSVYLRFEFMSEHESPTKVTLVVSTSRLSCEIYLAVAGNETDHSRGDFKESRGSREMFSRTHTPSHVPVDSFVDAWQMHAAHGDARLLSALLARQLRASACAVALSELFSPVWRRRCVDSRPLSPTHVAANFSPIRRVRSRARACRHSRSPDNATRPTGGVSQIDMPPAIKSLSSASTAPMDQGNYVKLWLAIRRPEIRWM